MLTQEYNKDYVKIVSGIGWEQETGIHFLMIKG